VATEQQDSFQVTTIDLLRHGACEGGEIFRGSTDSPLSARGWQQMRDNLRSDDLWQQLICSPLQRCQAFTEQLADQRQLPWRAEAGFQEIDFGDWEGQLTADIARQHPDQIQRFWKDPVNNAPPGAETMQEFQQRVVASWQTLLAQHQGQSVLLISHGGVIRIILAALLQMPMRPLSFIAVPHASFSRIQIYHQPGQDDWPQLMFHNRQTN